MIKVCACIGPMNCNDENCKLVKQYKKEIGMTQVKGLLDPKLYVDRKPIVSDSDRVRPWTKEELKEQAVMKPFGVR